MMDNDGNLKEIGMLGTERIEGGDDLGKGPG